MDRLIDALGAEHSTPRAVLIAAIAERPFEMTPERQRELIREEMVAIQGGDSEEVELMMEDYDNFVAQKDCFLCGGFGWDGWTEHETWCPKYGKVNS